MSSRRRRRRLRRFFPLFYGCILQCFFLISNVVCQFGITRRLYDILKISNVEIYNRDGTGNVKWEEKLNNSIWNFPARYRD